MQGVRAIGEMSLEDDPSLHVTAGAFSRDELLVSQFISLSSSTLRPSHAAGLAITPE